MRVIGAPLDDRELGWPHITDVADPAAVERMVQRAVSEFGRLDCAHNTAGMAGAGQPIPDYPLEEWYRGIDVMLTGAQKALALPPGFSLFSVSEKAFARAEKIPNRGFYFDFLEFKKQQAEWMTPSTPSIAHIHALQSKLDEIFEEGLDARSDRHARTNALVHDWVRRAGFDFFAEEGFCSKTLTCVKNNRGIDVLKLARDLREKHHLVIDPGYGNIRGQTFRLSNMGDETEETVSHLLACLDDCLG
ncbi:MAG TPA: hypothetical protein DCG89_07460 [Spartobacteria bacterium]|nr:hypothetical protein [Spartobacteria bacterium]